MTDWKPAMQVFSDRGAVTFLSGNSVDIPVNGIEGCLIPLVPATYPVDVWSFLSPGLILELLFQMVGNRSVW